MRYSTCKAGFACALLFAATASATSVPRLTFEELVDHSEVIATGHVSRSWADWDAGHKYIWTHYELAVSSAYKGTPASTVVISEPGGVVGGLGMAIAGTVSYKTGDNVLVFLQRMPNGYLRTTGWGQGQYRIDSNGSLHASASLSSVALVPTGSARAGAALTSLEGTSLLQIAARVSARVRIHPGVNGSIQ